MVVWRPLLKTSAVSPITIASAQLLYDKDAENVGKSRFFPQNGPNRPPTRVCPCRALVFRPGLSAGETPNLCGAFASSRSSKAIPFDVSAAAMFN
jgi:hypothetical protein